MGRCNFVDRVLPMGLRSSSQICQRVTSAVVFMYFNMGFMAGNYLDDFGGAEVPDRAIEAYIEHERNYYFPVDSRSRRETV